MVRDGTFSTGFHRSGTEVDSTSGTRLWKPVEKSPVPLYRCPMALTRRELLRTSAAAAPFLLTWDWKLIASGDFAQALVLTPAQTEGPFYPTSCRSIPTTICSIINDAITPAVGEITHLSGRDPRRQGQPDPQRRRRDLAVRQQRRLPAPAARGNRDKRDANFQGFGRFLTGSTGEYYFRTIKPVPYPGPHAAHPLQDQEQRQGRAHHAVLHQGPARQREGRRLARHPGRARPRAVRHRSISRRSRNSKIGELAAKFDIVLGLTPETDR